MAKRQKDYGTGIPRHEIEALARALLPTMQAFFESEEGNGSSMNGNQSSLRKRKLRKADS